MLERDMLKELVRQLSDDCKDHVEKALILSNEVEAIKQEIAEHKQLVAHTLH